MLPVIKLANIGKEISFKEIICFLCLKELAKLEFFFLVFFIYIFEGKK